LVSEFTVEQSTDMVKDMVARGKKFNIAQADVTRITWREIMGVKTQSRPENA
jgi:hypothetical protein